VSIAYETGQSLALMERWLAFCRAHGGICFVGWPDSILCEYLKFHAELGTLAWVEGASGEVTAMGIGWQCHRKDLETHWLPTNPEGECFYFAQIIWTDSAALVPLLHLWTERFPNWRQLQIWIRRRGKVRRIPHRLLVKMLKVAVRKFHRNDGIGIPASERHYERALAAVR